ncbi:hypothetical protein RD792_004080 [Penstemon davidsonii]|uniref:histone acetyltransferase n=1 Tax=Penstemon davidsonii TaxID=160366 RepID=A0ABR0DH12_9LAMI|nr:hypothetical protein RD792_004080 [Penstemon davidsonii]
MCLSCTYTIFYPRCLEVKKTPGEPETHTSIRGETHVLCQVPVNVIAADTEDKDAILDNDFFENRHSFLDFCQTNNYQFDTLRRAKYSSMMIMHHLRKMTALTMGTFCSICQQDITVEWHCEICSQFHVCNACYQKVGDACHVHKLSQHLPNADCKTKSKNLQEQKAAEVKAVLDLLRHASHCRTTRDKPCSYPKCLDIKKLFLHNRTCKSSVAGGCDTWRVRNLK